MRCPAGERGATLVELLVVLSILGVAASVVGLAAHRMDGRSEPDDYAPQIAASQIAVARREAIRTGRPAGLVVVVGGRPFDALAWPDGSVHADTALGIDPLTGRRHAAR